MPPIFRVLLLQDKQKRLLMHRVEPSHSDSRAAILIVSGTVKNWEIQRIQPSNIATVSRDCDKARMRALPPCHDEPLALAMPPGPCRVRSIALDLAPDGAAAPCDQASGRGRACRGTRRRPGNCRNDRPRFWRRRQDRHRYAVSPFVLWIKRIPLAVNHFAVRCDRHVNTGAAKSIGQFDRLRHCIGILAAMIQRFEAKASPAHMPGRAGFSGVISANL
jgi:hypothetical protein